MESCQIGWFAPECSENETRSNGPFGRRRIYEERERKEGADNATGRLDNVDWCNHARAVDVCLSCHPRRPPPSS